MNVTSTAHGRAVIMTLEGEMITGKLERFHRLVDDRLAKDARDLVIDVREVSYIDGEGVEALLRTARRAADRRGRIRLTGLSDPLHHIFLVARLEGYFSTHASVESALRSLRARAA